MIMNAILDTSPSYSLREAAVLSGLAEDRLRREVERKVIAPRAVVVGSAHRLRFGEFEILYLALLSSLTDAVELTPLIRGRVWRLLCERDPTGRFGKDRHRTWTAVH